MTSTAKATLERHLDELRSDRAYAAYERVRDRVLAMKDEQAEGVGIPSDYWQHELENFDYMIDASPIVVSRLRHHCYHLTGIRSYDYRSGKPDRRSHFEAKVRLLTELGGSDIRIPESPLLGGFGYEIDGGLYNIDTIKFFEVMIALRKAGILEALRGTAPVMCEIGSGWGGYAYQFKTLFPDATVALVDFPELFLFSGTYLLTAFPEARVSFSSDADFAERVAAGDADFYFVAHTSVDTLNLPRLDLTVNMVSFQEMTEEQVRKYVDWAADRRCRTLYSLNRDRSPYNPQLTSVRDVLRERYDLEEYDLLPVSYSKIIDPNKYSPQALAKRAAKEQQAAGGKEKGKQTVKNLLGLDARPPAPDPDHLDYRHVVGTLRT